MACIAPLVCPLPAAGAEAGPWQWAAGGKLDVLHASAPFGDRTMSHLSLRVDGDAQRAFGWPDTSVHVEVLSDQGGKLNGAVGSLQGLSNIEVARNAARLYAVWVERRFASGVSVLAGLYDLNSDFYATEASGTLIHPAFGIGSELSQTGRNGPSIFPNLSLGVRLKQTFASGAYLQLAVLDGVPGDPAAPGRTVLRLNRNDGALLVGEAGWAQTGAAATGMPTRWAAGAWSYTEPTAALDGGQPRRQRGGYVLAQARLLDGPCATTTGFVRAGVAQGQLNTLQAAWNAGVVIERPLGAAGPAVLTAGVASAVLGVAARAEPNAAANETAFEIGARWQWAPADSPIRWAIQPLAQRVRHVGGVGGASANVVGVRLEWSLGSGD